MTVKNLAGTLTHNVLTKPVSGAVWMMRHPIGTTARAFGLVRGAAEVGAGLVRGDQVRVNEAPEGAQEHHDAVRAASERAQETDSGVPQQRSGADPEPAAAPETSAGPPLREPLPAAPQRTPEELSGSSVQESFATEPKAASRDSEHGGRPGDREEIDHYVEEIELEPGANVDVETPVGTTGAAVGTNPDTAEADLQQPGTAPLLDPSVAKSLRSESETLQKAADVEKS